MKKLILIILTILSEFQAYSQIDEYMENVVLIQSKDKKESASGFLFYTGKNVFLLTAKHVILTEDLKLINQGLIFSSYPHDSKKEKAVEYSVNLDTAFFKKKVRCLKNSDIIAIQIGKVNENKLVSYYDFVNREGGINNINIFSIDILYSQS